MTHKTFLIRTGIVSFFVTLIGLAVTIGWTIASKNLHANYFITPNSPPPSNEVMNKVESQLALVSNSYGFYGSGCQLTPEVVLASRHQVGNIILDKLIGVDVDIFINDKKARVLKYSSTLGDTVFLTIKMDSDPAVDDSVFSKTTPEVNQIVYTKGHPGAIANLFQGAKIIKVETNHQGFTILTISGDYIELGISGSCIYDTDGYVLGVIKEKETLPPHIAIVTVVKGY